LPLRHRPADPAAKLARIELGRVFTRLGRFHRGFLFIMSADTKAYKVKKTDTTRRARLAPMQFEVARRAATERAFTGKYRDFSVDPAAIDFAPK
jgi:hypothetical protein